MYFLRGKKKEAINASHLLLNPSSISLNVILDSILATINTVTIVNNINAIAYQTIPTTNPILANNFPSKLL